MLVDLDRFKQVKDRFGHQAGDRVLRTVGRALAGAVRGEDMVARFGGDEFVGLLSFEARSGRAVAERMLAAVRAAGAVPGDGVRATVSIGIAVTGADRDVEGTLAAADRAMYAAKRSGGDLALTEGDLLEPVRTGPGARKSDGAGAEPVPGQ